MDKEINERRARIRALAWRSLEALGELIHQVRDPQVRKHLEKQQHMLLHRLKQERY